MNEALMARAFNEWMRRYIDEPERFAREFEEVRQFLTEAATPEGPGYGRECVACLTGIMGELEAADRGERQAQEAGTEPPGGIRADASADVQGMHVESIHLTGTLGAGRSI